MEETTDFGDWELLHREEDSKPLEEIDAGSEDGAIKLDYFALDSEGRRQAARASSDEEVDQGGVDSDNPSWVDPDSDSRYGGRMVGEVGFGSSAFPLKNSSGFWSDESSDGQRSLPDSERRELGGFDYPIMEFSGEGDGKGLSFGGIATNNGTTAEQEQNAELDSGELVHTSSGNCDSANSSNGGGEKKELVWWKMPLDLLKYCAFRVKPLWSISIAAAFMGLFVLGRRMYKMKHKSRSIPLKIAIDDKRASHFAVRAARLNEAFSVVRRVPIIRTPPSGGVAPWSMVPVR
ncbi:uncharacterized protein [Typha angustifolia]|uniref:uncharacterized protein n=1 Tax=Typha angustifolia TaxID=59011 RepID=UPI003C30E873